MKKVMFFLAVFFFGWKAMAQPPRGGKPGNPGMKKGEMQARKENLEAQKVAFLTSKANLTPEESARFWPIYNKFEDEKKSIKKLLRAELNETKKDFATLSDAEVERNMVDMLDLRQKEIELERRSFQEFKKVLPVKKVAMIIAGEKEFYQQVLKNAMR
jgi:hypothetical protein